MFKFTYNDVDVSVDFEQQNSKTSTTKGTKCRIELSKDNKHIASYNSHAILHKNDNFNKSIGRKVALTKCLKMMTACNHINTTLTSLNIPYLELKKFKGEVWRNYWLHRSSHCIVDPYIDSNYRKIGWTVQTLNKDREASGNIIAEFVNKKDALAFLHIKDTLN